MTVKPIKRNILFYAFEITKRRKVVDLTKIFEDISNLSLDNYPKGRYLPHSDGRDVAFDIVDFNYPIKAVMNMNRREMLPDVEHHDGTSTPLNLNPDDGLSEKTHFIIFKKDLNSNKDIVGIEYNHYGPRPQNLRFYITKIFSLVESDITLEPLYDHDLFKIIDTMKEIHQIRMHIPRHLVDKMDIIPGLNNALNILSNDNEFDEVDIVLKKRSGFDDFKDRIKDFFRRDQHQGLTKFQVNSINSETDRMKYYNLLNYQIIKEEFVNRRADNSKYVDTNDVFLKIQNAYTFLKSSQIL